MSTLGTSCGLAAIVLAASSAFAGAGRTGAWRDPAVREAMAAWAGAEAHRMSGEHAASAKQYAEAVERCTRALEGMRDPACTHILRAILDDASGRRRAAPAEDRPASSADMLREMAILKAQGDHLAEEGKVARARLAYEAVGGAGKQFRERFPGDRGVKAASWLSQRARSASRPLERRPVLEARRLGKTVEETLRETLIEARERERQRAVGILDLRLDILRVDVSRPLIDDWRGRRLVEGPGLPGDLAAALQPALGPTRFERTLGELRAYDPAPPPRLEAPPGMVAVEPWTTEALDATGLSPLGGVPAALGLAESVPVGEAVLGDVASCRDSLAPLRPTLTTFGGERGDELAIAGWRRVLSSVIGELRGGEKPFDPAEGRAFLEWVIAADAAPDLVGRLADALTRVRQPPAEGAVTMGGHEDDAAAYRSIALDAYLNVLERLPERDTDGHITEKAFRLAAELGGVADPAAHLRERLEGESPRPPGVHHFRLLATQRRDGPAYELLARMSQQPERYLPASRATATVLLQGFGHFTEEGEAAVAERLLGALAPYGLDGRADRQLALARAYRDAGQPAAVRRVVEQFLADSPDKVARARGLALLDRGRAVGGERVKTEEELIAMAEAARVNPRQYAALAQEYRRAEMYDKAREAYGFAARRFDDLAARGALVETYFEEGRWAEAEAAAAEFIDEHHGKAAAVRLDAFVTRQYRARGDVAGWTRLSLCLAASKRADVAWLYAGRLAGLLVKARRGQGTPLPGRVAAAEERLRASPRWPLIEAQLDQQARDLGRALVTRLNDALAARPIWRPWWTAVRTLDTAPLKPLWPARRGGAPDRAADF